MRENLSQAINLYLVRLIRVDSTGETLPAFFMLAGPRSDHHPDWVSDSCGKGGDPCGQQ